MNAGFCGKNPKGVCFDGPLPNPEGVEFDTSLAVGVLMCVSSPVDNRVAAFWPKENIGCVPWLSTRGAIIGVPEAACSNVVDAGMIVAIDEPVNENAEAVTP